jgi:hypothetical protein
MAEIACLPVSFDSSRNFNAVDIIKNRNRNKRSGVPPEECVTGVSEV